MRIEKLQNNQDRRYVHEVSRQFMQIEKWKVKKEFTDFELKEISPISFIKEVFAHKTDQGVSIGYYTPE